MAFDNGMCHRIKQASEKVRLKGKNSSLTVLMFVIKIHSLHFNKKCETFEFYKINRLHYLFLVFSFRLPNLSFSVEALSEEGCPNVRYFPAQCHLLQKPDTQC